MILMLIFVSAIIISYVIRVIGLKKDRNYFDDHFGVALFAQLLCICGIGASAICAIAIPIEQCQYNNSYKKWNTRQVALEERIDLWEQGNADNTLFSDITNFNVELVDEQYWSSNLWTNWFNDSACQHFDKIEIPKNMIESED